MSAATSRPATSANVSSMASSAGRDPSSIAPEDAVPRAMLIRQMAPLLPYASDPCYAYEVAATFLRCATPAASAVGNSGPIKAHSFFDKPTRLPIVLLKPSFKAVAESQLKLWPQRSGSLPCLKCTKVINYTFYSQLEHGSSTPCWRAVRAGTGAERGHNGLLIEC